MSTATLERTHRHAGNIDRDAGIIRHCKILGTESKKGRTYPRAVIAKAAPMYEGIRVNIDHVDPGARRSYRDRIGSLRNISIEPDGLYGDFHVNRAHPLADQVFEDAERAPNNLGFSHDTRGNSRSVNGKQVVESIDKVLSVDLVANPATTEGLFESGDGRKSVFREIRRALRGGEPKSITANRLARTRAKYSASTPIAELAEPVELRESYDDDLRTLAQRIAKYRAPDRHGRQPAYEFESSAPLMEDTIQEAWSPAARAAALAIRRLHAQAKAAATPEAASAAAEQASKMMDADTPRPDGRWTAGEADRYEAEGEFHARNAHLAAARINRKAGNEAKAKYHEGKAKDHDQLAHDAYGDDESFRGNANKATQAAEQKTSSADEIDEARRVTGSGKAKQESMDESNFEPYIPPASAPLATRMARFYHSPPMFAAAGALTEDVLQEWSDASRAAALAVRRAHAMTEEGDTSDFDAAGKKTGHGPEENAKAHADAADAAEAAAKDASPDAAKAWKLTAEAHNAAAGHELNGGEKSAKRTANKHRKAAAAWQKAGDKEMVKHHMNAAKYYDQDAEEQKADEDELDDPDSDSGQPVV